MFATSNFMKDLLKINGFEISYHEKSNRIINIKIEDEIIDRLAFHLKNLILQLLSINHLQDSILLKV